MKCFQNALRAHGRGDLAKAEAGYLATLAKHTQHVDAIRLLGLLYHQQGNALLAAAFLGRAAVLNPDDATLHLDLGVIYKLNNYLDRAAEHLNRAAALDPTLVAAHLHLGEVKMALAHWDAAIACFRAAANLDPTDTHVLMQLGNALHLAERPREALVAFRSAIALNPNSVTARVGAGTSLCATEDYDAALSHLQAALGLDSQCVPAWYNLGCARLGLGNYDEAVTAFSHTIELQPDWPAAHLNRSLALLSAGDFERGLPAYEWRLGAVNQESASASPRWEGTPLESGSLLIYAEQGLGDTIQFLRFVDLARRLAPNIVLRVQPSVLPIAMPLEQKWGIRVVDAPTEDIPADFSCPLISLPHVLGASLESPMLQTAYIEVPQAYREKWANMRKAPGGRRIGLAWSGHRRPYDIRPIPLTDLERLFCIASIEWVVLQQAITQSDHMLLANSPHTARIRRLPRPLSDLADTAAVIEQLDAVISIDTAIAHIAGAMGTPTLVMLPFAADWRWRIDGSTSRWYQHARLVRQQQAGQWSTAVAEVERLLRSNQFAPPP